MIKWSLRTALYILLTAMPLQAIAQEQISESASESAPESSEAIQDEESGRAPIDQTADQTAKIEIHDGQVLLHLPDETVHTLDVPCKAESMVQVEDTLFLACGVHGLVVVSISDPGAPEVLDAYNLGGSVTDLFVAQDYIWAQVSRLEARPVAPVVPGADLWVPEKQASRSPDGPSKAVLYPFKLSIGERQPTSPKQTESPDQTPVPTSNDDAQAPIDAVSPAVIEGKVIEVSQGYVVVDFGKEDGISREDKVELFVETGVDLGGGELASREELVAVGVVSVVTENRAQVTLGLNERVPPGAQARISSRKITSTQWAPRRLGNIWHTQLMFRPFLALGTLGIGTVSDITVSYLFDAPFTLSAVFNPAGIGIARDGNIFALAGHLIAAYDTTAFRVGLGAGWSSLNDRNYDPFGSQSRVSSAFSIAQDVRLGSEDGLNTYVVNSFMLYRDQFDYAGTKVSSQIPTGSLARGTWLVLRGGGSSTGYAFGEVGLRVLVHGNGDRGSIFLTPTLGGAQLRGQKTVSCPPGISGDCVENIDYGGPMIGFGVDWRL